MAAVDNDRGGNTRCEKTRANKTFLLQSSEKEGRADCQGSHREEAPGMDLPHAERREILSGSGKGGCRTRERRAR